MRLRKRDLKVLAIAIPALLIMLVVCWNIGRIAMEYILEANP